MAANDLQSFLRFLTQDAKVPLAMAMGKVKDLQQASLGSVDALAKVKAVDIQAIFPDEKVAKQILSAAKRISKKRAAGDDTPSPKKKRKDESLFSIKGEQTPEELEASLALPTCDISDEELQDIVMVTNRAPLVLAFGVMLLRYTMPEQPLSSRLSLAQAYVSVTSRARAVNLGIESGDSAEQLGFGEGQPTVTIMGKELRVLRRWGYDWKPAEASEEASTQGTLKAEDNEQQQGSQAAGQPEASSQGTLKVEDDEQQQVPQAESQPPLWGLDLEALKKSKAEIPPVAKAQSATTSNMPIYTPQSARAYLLKSFESPPSDKKSSAAAKAAEKERNLGMLLRAIDLLYQSWLGTITPEELDKRICGWYCKVRPSVENGVAGWGGRNEVKLADILALRRVP